ncbi:hypothetical protein [Pseudomonas uvaldensis]|uniref:hypothetical protein n=1 Tax=Pseudomonas uvaldensis TaxID=2878385 RepID=UPI001E507064|nr:hypothetical protein [Pseudomonas uvaldensis]MCE0460990.1 hypothetical protein [Pseudomonas uvaldensis]
MAVKVGASLWAVAADQHRAPVRETQARNFEQKIGLGEHPKTANEGTGSQRNDHLVPESGRLHVQDSELEPGRVVRPGSGDVSSSAAVGTLELYALGAHAGHHLSYLPDIFLMGQGALCVAPVQVEERYSGVSTPTLMTSSGSPIPGEILNICGNGQIGEPAGLELQEAESSASQPLLSYLTWKWPDRQFHFLPRGKGLELFVRDYQLTAQERDELIEELSRRASSMPERPQQIWLNGQEIWRASAVSNDYEGEHNGR